MKSTLFAAIIAFVMSTTAIASEAGEVIDTISGKGFQIIRTAIPELQRAKLEIRNYRVLVIEKGQSYVVLFEDPKQDPREFGSGPHIYNFEVELRKLDLHVMRANFVK